MPPSCKINYVNMQHYYVHMQHNYINVGDDYVTTQVMPVILLHVDIKYLACEGQKYATRTIHTCMSLDS